MSKHCAGLQRMECSGTGFFVPPEGTYRHEWNVSITGTAHKIFTNMKLMISIYKTSILELPTTCSTLGHSEIIGIHGQHTASAILQHGNSEYIVYCPTSEIKRKCNIHE